MDRHALQWIELTTALDHGDQHSRSEMPSHGHKGDLPVLLCARPERDFTQAAGAP